MNWEFIENQQLIFLRHGDHYHRIIHRCHKLVHGGRLLVITESNGKDGETENGQLNKQ